MRAVQHAFRSSHAVHGGPPTSHAIYWSVVMCMHVFCWIKQHSTFPVMIRRPRRDPTLIHLIPCNCGTMKGDWMARSCPGVKAFFQLI